jgi:hypothetical protein
MLSVVGRAKRKSSSPDSPARQRHYRTSLELTGEDREHSHEKDSLVVNPKIVDMTEQHKRGSRELGARQQRAEVSVGGHNGTMLVGGVGGEGAGPFEYVVT